MDPKILLGHLSNLEELWGTEALSRDEVSDFSALLIRRKIATFWEQYVDVDRILIFSIFSCPFLFAGRMYRRNV